MDNKITDKFLLRTCTHFYFGSVINLHNQIFIPFMKLFPIENKILFFKRKRIELWVEYVASTSLIFHKIGDKKREKIKQFVFYQVLHRHLLVLIQTHYLQIFSIVKYLQQILGFSYRNNYAPSTLISQMFISRTFNNNVAFDRS